MRVAFWSTSFLKGYGGAERVVCDLANYFAERGADVYVIGDRPGRKPTTTLAGGLHDRVTVYARPFSNPLLVARQPLRFLGRTVRYLVSAVQFGFFLRKHRIQIVHLHLVNVDVLLLALYRRLFKYRLVITFTGMEIEWATAGALSDLKLRIALKSADHVTAVSSEICERLQARYAVQAPDPQYIPNGIDCDKTLARAREAPGRAIEPDHFVFCGRLHPVKRVPQLVDTFRRCLANGCDRKLYIIGNGEEEDAVRDRVARYGMAERVCLLGALPHTEVLRVMERCRCLILNSASEGCPLVVLEAMALSKPVIAPDVGGVGALIRHGQEGFLFAPDADAGDGALYRAVMKLAADPVLAACMGRHAYRTVARRFRFSTIATSYREVYARQLALGVTKQASTST